MVHFSLNIKACCLYLIWEKQDQIWAKIFASPKICTPVHLCAVIPEHNVFCYSAVAHILKLSR